MDGCSLLQSGQGRSFLFNVIFVNCTISCLHEAVTRRMMRTYVKNHGTNEASGKISSFVSNYYFAIVCLGGRGMGGGGGG